MMTDEQKQQGRLDDWKEPYLSMPECPPHCRIAEHHHYNSNFSAVLPQCISLSRAKAMMGGYDLCVGQTFDIGGIGIRHEFYIVIPDAVEGVAT